MNKFHNLPASLDALAFQELLKGDPNTLESIGLDVGGRFDTDSEHGGWGFNLSDYFTCEEMTEPEQIPSCYHMRPEDANLLDINHLKTKPFFTKNPKNSFLYSNSPVAVNDPKLLELLANEMPALTFATGHKGVGVSEPMMNIDMRQKYLVEVAGEWPEKRERYEWRHNDLFLVSYPYLYRMYDDWSFLTTERK